MENLNQWEELSQNYNVVRETKKGVKMPKKEIIVLLKFLPSITNFMTIYIKYGLLVKEENNLYSLPNHPVMWHEIKKSVIAVKAKISEYNRRHQNKDVISDKFASIQKFMQEYNITEDDLTSYLTSTGNYKIQKRIEEWVNL